jgi:hypothetical protein
MRVLGVTMAGSVAESCRTRMRLKFANGEPVLQTAFHFARSVEERDYRMRRKVNKFE